MTEPSKQEQLKKFEATAKALVDRYGDRWKKVIQSIRRKMENK